MSAGVAAAERLATAHLIARLDRQWSEIVRRVGGRQGLLTHGETRGEEDRLTVAIGVWSTRPWLFGLFPSWRSGKVEVRVFADRTVRLELHRDHHFGGCGTSWHMRNRDELDHVVALEMVVDLLERGLIRRGGTRTTYHEDGSIEEGPIE